MIWAPTFSEPPLSVTPLLSSTSLLRFLDFGDNCCSCRCGNRHSQSGDPDYGKTNSEVACLITYWMTDWYTHWFEWITDCLADWVTNCTLSACKLVARRRIARTAFSHVAPVFKGGKKMLELVWAYVATYWQDKANTGKIGAHRGVRTPVRAEPWLERSSVV